MTQLLSHEFITLFCNSMIQSINAYKLSKSTFKQYQSVERTVYDYLPKVAPLGKKIVQHQMSYMS